jgi:uncharacterized protein DUF3313
MKTGLLIAALLVAGAAHAQSDFDKRMAYDGLEPVKVKGISAAYRRPGATLSAYRRVLIDPVEVRFHKSWNPTSTGSRLPLPAADREAIRTDLAKLVREQFANTLTEKGRYPVVGEPGPDVLRIKIYIVNLYINAPDNPGPGVSRTFVTSAGEMTLFMELFDSETGQILARAVDRQESRSANMIGMANRVTNIGEAGDITAQWARIMRDALDRAHAAMK